MCLMAAALVAVLVACAGGTPVEDLPQSDQLERTNRVARVAFQQGRYAQAESLYRKVAELAYERDDVNAAVDAQYNAAVCLVRLDRIDEADDLLRRTKAELERANQTEPVELRLLEATVLYRQRRFDEARSLTEQIVAAYPASPAAHRAQFLRGLIAAEQEDPGRLRAAIADLDAAATDDRLKADRMELAGHLALLERRYDESITEFSESARLRSAAYDYRGTVRALAKAGKASEAAGKPGQASVHYLRAGRSALHQGARERAHALLTQAHALAETAGDADTAREAQLYLTRLEDSGPAGSPDS
jgi:tetratricopeptide (TPR) repeat protein